jgi:thioredoxin reductase (NADPH)
MAEGDSDDDDDDDDDDGGMDWMSGPPDGQPEMEIVECDVAIIGGGPAGATCALYTSRADLKTVILDKNEAVGALAITSHIANYPGVDRAMTGMELLQQMKTQATEYGTRICERAQVFMIEINTDDTEKDANGEKPYNKIIYTPDITVKARSIVLATGAMGRSMPYLPGEEKYLGQGVSYCATCDGAFYRDAEVAVFGATGEALEEALFLTKFASTVHWITPIDITGYLERLEAEKTASAGSSNNVEFNHLFEEGTLKDLLSKPNVKHHNKARLREVEGNVSGVTGVRVRNIGDSKADDKVIEVEGAFIYGAGGGSKPITEFLSGSGIDLDDAGGVIVDDSMESVSQKGVFAIGDIRNTPYKQVVVAAADGCVAAMSIEKFLKDRKIIKVDWIHK